MNPQKLIGNVGTRLLPCSLPECAALARSALASWLSRIIASDQVLPKLTTNKSKAISGVMRLRLRAASVASNWR